MAVDPPSIEAAWDALHAHDRFRPRYPSESVIRFVARRFDPSHPSLILDLGCGAGRHSVLIAEMGHHPVSVDYSLIGLQHTREVLPQRGSLAQCTMTALPFPPASVDGIVAFGVLLYGRQADFEQACTEIRRVLRPGGWASIVTRTADDSRASLGDPVEPGTILISDNTTNEDGMLMHFLDDAAVQGLCERFSDHQVDRIDHTAGGGALHNSDWVIELQR